MSEKCKNVLIFFDESSINTNMARRYARTKKEERAVDRTPINTSSNTMILFSIRISSEAAHTVYSDGTTTEQFADYLKLTLMPTLSKTDIIVMDNMRSHHAKFVKQVLDESGIKYLYLPPYNPNLNLIEKMWSKLKAYLRKEKVRITSDVIERVFSTILLSDYAGWFRLCNCAQ